MVFDEERKELIRKDPVKNMEDLFSKDENKKIIEVIETVKDPEIGIDIWSLGLIYDIEVNKNKVKIVMTLTSPMCPYGPQMLAELNDSLEEKKYIVNIELTFDPPWEPSEELRSMLGV